MFPSQLIYAQQSNPPTSFLQPGPTAHEHIRLQKRRSNSIAQHTHSNGSIQKLLKQKLSIQTTDGGDELRRGVDGENLNGFSVVPSENETPRDEHEKCETDRHQQEQQENNNNSKHKLILLSSFYTNMNCLINYVNMKYELIIMYIKIIIILHDVHVNAAILSCCCWWGWWWWWKW